MNGTALPPPLIFNDAAQKPGLHALIIGVSAYDFLGKVATKPTDPTMLTISNSLPQLEGPAQAARDLADFLIARKDKLAKPLSTLRFLAAPSAKEAAGSNAFQGVMAPTSDNIVAAIKAWQKDAARSNDEATLFFFSGHGTQVSKVDSIILPQDFLGGATVFDKTIKVMDIWNGMAVSKSVQAIAQSQFYFIDACRDDQDLYRTLDTLDVRTPLFIDPLGVDKRNAPIFFAAGPGQQTKVGVTRSTRFGARLLSCLSGGGGVKQNKQWVVTVNALQAALNLLSDYENLGFGSKLDSFEFDKSTNGREVIHSLDATPSVPCTLRFEASGSALKGRSIVMRTLLSGTRTIPPELADPHRTGIDAGHYAFSADPVGLFQADEIDIRPPLIDIRLGSAGIEDLTLDQRNL